VTLIDARPGGAATATATRFRHEALLYGGIDEFVGETSRFIRDALAAEEPILVVVGSEKIGHLKDELGPDAAAVDFRDMADVGHNPALIIPAWYDFVADRATDGRHIRGIGEPINAELKPEALIECERHESLLNLAFADASAWWLLCPYDVTHLDSSVTDEALRNHPFVMQEGTSRDSASYRGLDDVVRPFDAPLPEPAGAEEITFELEQLAYVRRFVTHHAAKARLGDDRVADLVLAVNEAATNSLRHGGGKGALRVWREGDRLVFEIRDAGAIEQPLVGRRRPSPGQEGGFGMWLVHHLCDLVQLRTFQNGSVVRLHMGL
jgi:anti-sigma regulatory factor (Ser/Thr protein kinase)